PVPSNAQCAFLCDFYDIWDFQSTTDTLLLELKQCFVDERCISESTQDLRLVFEALARTGNDFKVLKDL
ncbi:MAG: hypothetical protein SOT27_00495, partial [Helicobacter sp.]|nr:hypothetical protein [Helicobacter sp.]